MFSPAALRGVPAPSQQACASHERLAQWIRDEIRAAGGFIGFERFMALALYAPGCGYYTGGSAKLGAHADFVTAPELTPLFARSLAAPVAQLVDAGCTHVLELGAGTGRLAADLLAALAARDRLPARYSILEVSAELRERQRAALAACPASAEVRIDWLDELPPRFAGTLLANEVLDAMPVALVRREGARLLELGVSLDDDGAFDWRTREVTGALAQAAATLPISDGMTSEVHLAARAFVATLATMLDRGAALIIDYGFPRHEYYHPQRHEGTLMCHYRQRAHGNPLVQVGLQDITSHLDFTTLAETAVAGGLELLGYVDQARFLINCGITDLLAALDPRDVRRYAPAAAAVQKLMSPSEMGELFKVIAFGRGIVPPLVGFQAGDRRHRL